MNGFCVKSYNGFWNIHYLYLNEIYINGNNVIYIYKAKFTLMGNAVKWEPQVKPINGFFLRMGNDQFPSWEL